MSPQGTAEIDHHIINGRYWNVELRCQMTSSLSLPQKSSLMTTHAYTKKKNQESHIGNEIVLRQWDTLVFKGEHGENEHWWLVEDRHGQVGFTPVAFLTHNGADFIVFLPRGNDLPPHGCMPYWDRHSHSDITRIAKTLNNMIGNFRQVK